MKRGYRIVCIILVLMVLLSISFLCYACSSSEEDTKYYIYVKNYVYDEDTNTVTAVLGFTTESDKEISSEAVFDSSSTQDNVFYYKQTTYISFSTSIFYLKVDEIFTDDIKYHNDVLYNNTKFRVDYVTSLKSIKSDGKVTRSGKYYIHSYDATNGNMNITLTRKYANQASWYGVLIGCSVAGLTIGLVIALCVKKKKDKVREQENA